jgi:hypothetical protein
MVTCSMSCKLKPENAWWGIIIKICLSRMFGL